MANNSNLPRNRAKSRMIVFSALLFAFVAYPQEPTVSPATDAGIEKVLRPYLGTWRPTSAAEERNIGSLTISPEGLSLKSGEELKYRLERQTDEGVILRVTEGFPGDLSPGRALAFSLRTEMVRSGDIPPGPKVELQILWIYWCNRLEQLSGSFDKAACSKNGYRR